MPPSTLTLIGSGEFAPSMVAVHRAIVERATASGQPPTITFFDTPAGFQPNADDLTEAARQFYLRELGLPLTIASARHASLTPEALAAAQAALAQAQIIVAGPGSPTYALRQWRALGLSQTLLARFHAGAHLIFASSAAIALSRHALPVYEICKVGDDPFWQEGLDLLGLPLAIVPHWNHREPRCFIGHARFAQAAAHIPTALFLGLDENTALTLDFTARTAQAFGAGQITLQRGAMTHTLKAGDVVALDILTETGFERGPQRVARGATHAAQPTLKPSANEPPAPLAQWAAEREAHRLAKRYAESDHWRDRIAQTGYAIKDAPTGPQLLPARYATASAVPQWNKPDACAWTITLLAHNDAPDVLRAARSVLAHAGDHTLELLLADNGSDDDTAWQLAAFACDDARARVIRLAPHLGEGAGRNATLRAARGQHILILGAHVAFAGDVLTPLTAALADDAVGAVGSHPLLTRDLFSFEPAPPQADSLIPADALEFYAFAFRRARLPQAGWLDEKFVFYRNLDLDWSLAFKAQGLRLRGIPGLPLTFYEHRWYRLDPVERDKLSRKNYRRFLDKWRERKDLLIAHTPKT